MHYIAYYRQDQKARNLKKRNVHYYALPSFAHLSRVLSGLKRV